MLFFDSNPEVSLAPQTQTAQKVLTESAPMAAIKTESVTAANAKVEIQQRILTQKKVEEKNQILRKKKTPVNVFDRSEGPVPLSHKLDVSAQKSRIQQLKTAVQKIFPAFNYSYRAPLHEVAAVLEKPTVQTTSQLILELGKKVDGSEVWRDALISDVEVTGAQAMQTGLEAITIYNPVAVREEGPAVEDKDVKRVLDEEDVDENYALAA